MIGQKIKNYSSLIFLPENLEKHRLTELYDAPVEGLTIFFTAVPPAVLPWIALDQMTSNMHFSAGQDVTLKNYGARTISIDYL